MSNTPAWVKGLSKSVTALIGSTQYQPQGYAAVQPSLAAALGRSQDSFGSQMGPGYPLIPLPIDPLGPNGRPEPRKYQYDISDNLVVSKRLPMWNTLKAASEQCDIVGRCITIAQRELAKLEWSFTVSSDAINRIMSDSNVGHAEASNMARQQNKDQIARLQEFWENPYPQNDRGWREWVTEALFQILVYDGLAIYPKMSLGGDVIGFLIIDAPTIKILLDNYGDIPRPPDVAYQQVLWGFPRGEFVASPDSNVQAAFYAGEYGIDERDQLSYFVMNRRSHTVYGWSAVEQSLELINIYLERQKWLLSEYRHGSSAEVYLKTTGNDLTLSNMRAYENLYNDYLEGSTANRHKTKLLPDGWDPIFAPTLDERYKENYDEHLIKRIAGMFGISAQQLGVIPRAGMGGGKGAQEGEQDNAETVSLLPLMSYVEEVVNSLGRRYMGQTKDVTFTLLQDDGGKDALSQAQAEKVYVTTGLKTVNEIRADQGLPLLDFAEADQPFVVAGTAVTFLKGQLEEDGLESAPSQESQVPQTPETADKGEAPQVGLDDAKADEVKAYKKFMSKPRARQFVFKHHTPEEAALIKASVGGDSPKDLTKRKVTELPGYLLRRALEDKHARAILKALAGVTGTAEWLAQAMRAVESAGELATIPAAVDSAAHLATFNPSSLAQALKDLYTESSSTGTEQAVGMLKQRVPLVKMGQRLQTMLNEADSKATEIHQTTLGRIRTEIVNGISNGLTHTDISKNINAILNDPTRASMIAITETNSSYNAGFIDQLQAAGETSWDWLAYDDACDVCQEQESANPHGLNDLQPCDGSHPNCRCTVVVSQ